MRAYYCHSIFSFLFFNLHCFFFLMFLFAILVWWFSQFSFFSVSYLCCRFLFCDYHMVCIKCLIDKIVFFSLLIASYLDLPVSIIFFLPFHAFVVTNNLILCPEFVTKLQQKQLFFNVSFPKTQSFVYFCFFHLGQKPPFNISCKENLVVVNSKFCHGKILFLFHM